jgi:hypothetical protein
MVSGTRYTSSPYLACPVAGWTRCRLPRPAGGWDQAGSPPAWVLPRCRRPSRLHLLARDKNIIISFSHKLIKCRLCSLHKIQKDRPARKPELLGGPPTELGTVVAWLAAPPPPGQEKKYCTLRYRDYVFFVENDRGSRAYKCKK